MLGFKDYSEELQQRLKQARQEGKTHQERLKIIQDSDEYKERTSVAGMAARRKKMEADIKQQRLNEARKNMAIFEGATKNLAPEQLAARQKEGNAFLAQRAAENKKNEEADARKNAAFIEQKNREDLASDAAMKAKNLAITRAAGIPDSPDVYKKGGSVKSASSRADGCAIRGKTRA